MSSLWIQKGRVVTRKNGVIVHCPECPCVKKPQYRYLCTFLLRLNGFHTGHDGSKQTRHVYEFTIPDLAIARCEGTSSFANHLNPEDNPDYKIFKYSPPDKVIIAGYTQGHYGDVYYSMSIYVYYYSEINEPWYDTGKISVKHTYVTDDPITGVTYDMSFPEDQLSCHAYIPEEFE